MRKVIFATLLFAIYIVLNYQMKIYIEDYRDLYFIGEYSIFPIQEDYDFINLGRSIGSDSFSWDVVDGLNGLNMGMAGKPLSTDILLLNYYESLINDRAIIIIPISFSFFCSDESPYTPFETIYNFDLPLLGMVQSNATIEYVLKSKGFISLTSNRNKQIPYDYFPDMLFQPDICEDNNLSLYVDLINSIQINKEKVFIVLTPHYMDFATSNDTDGFKWFYEMMEEMVRLTEVRFLDYSNLEIVQDKKYFNDFVHLNQNGREVFTEHFVDSLPKHG
jgi:hypothetical protein